jgi:uncharacterized membrane protein
VEVTVPTISKSIDVDIPVRVAYDQWAQFESFPRFMAGVKSVTRLDETHVRWAAGIGGRNVRWDAEITQQVPDRLISWHSTTGAPNRGTVRFTPLSDTRTRVDLTIDYKARGVMAKMGAAVGLDDRLVETVLREFKRVVESRGNPRGGWRGHIVS